MYVQYNMNQTSLPLELSTCIDPNHIVFSIYYFVDSLDENQIEHLIKYNRFDKEQKKGYKQSDKNLENWVYNEKLNTFTHPDGTIYNYSHQSNRRNKLSGYTSQVAVYKPTDPENAPQKALYYNEKYQILKNTEAEKLLSKKGSTIFAKRKIDVEPVFGQIKANLGFT